MDITKTQVKTALGITTDAALGRFLKRSRQQLNRYDDDQPLPEIIQLQLKANHKSLVKKISNP